MVKGRFYSRGAKFEAKMEIEDGSIIELGIWESIDEAAGAVIDASRKLQPVNPSMLHLYVRHRRDTQSYGNVWVDDFRLRSITTYETVAEYCKNALECGHRVRVHRRRFAKIPATICSECSVSSVARIEGTNGFKAEFKDWVSLTIEREKRLQQGYYFDSPANYESASA